MNGRICVHIAFRTVNQINRLRFHQRKMFISETTCLFVATTVTRLLSKELCTLDGVAQMRLLPQPQLLHKPLV